MPTYSDPVAESALNFLRTHISKHPETLVVYAKWYGNMPEIITAVDIAKIDRKGMTLRCSLKAGGEIHVHVPIAPPLKANEDAKLRLLEMKALAQEGLGIIKPPQVAKFYFPLPSLLSLSALIMHAISIYAPPSTVPHSVILITTLGGMIKNCTKEVFYAGLLLHVLEAPYMIHLCRKHQIRLGLTVAYVVATLIFGFNICLNLKKEVKALRIKSLMKVE